MPQLLRGRTTVVAGLTAALIAFSATAAYADLTLTLPNTGTMKHIDDVDVFQICDTEADGAGVTGSLLYRRYNTTDVRRLWSESDGGDSGCDKFPWDVTDGGQYWMKLCWNGTDFCRTSESFNE